MGGNSTISSMQPAAGNLRVQTSVYGAAIPLVYGRARVSGNLVWYGGFKAIPHTSTTSSGGKGGGGVTQENTTYTYTAAAMMALCEGPINTVLSAWVGKQRYGGQAANGVSATYHQTVTIPVGGLVTVDRAATYQRTVGVADGRWEKYDHYNEN